MSDKKPHTAKEKKEALRKKNRKLFEMFTVAQRQADKVDIAAPVFEPPKEPEKPMAQIKDEATEAQMQQIRDRISGRKRAATDKWNRFAGTSGAGGRGR